MSSIDLSSVPAVRFNTAFRMNPQTSCPNVCRFALCSPESITLGAPDTAVGPTICRRDQNIEYILETGEARVVQGGSRIPISQWRPEGLRVPFSRDFFYAIKLPGVPRLSGVAFRPPQENQYRFIDDLCIILPIKRYQRELNGRLYGVNAGSSNDCLAVSLRVPSVVIELNWFSGDDMDLSVVEPGGFRISSKQKTSKCGRLNRDNGIDICGLFDRAKERVEYSLPCPEFQNGTYTAVVRHTGNCGSGSTRFVLRVVVNGTLSKSINGESNKNRGAKVATLRFTLP